VEVLEIAAFGPDEDERPDIVWLNVSSVDDPVTPSRQLAALAERCADSGILFYVGGREAPRLELEGVAGVVMHDSMREFADTVLQRLPASEGSPPHPAD
jgi:hypothetical protein